MNPNMEISSIDVRSAAILTNSYVAGNVFSMTRDNTLGLEVDFTIGSLTSLDLKVEVSNDGGTTYAQQVSESTTAGETTVSLHAYTFEATGIYSVQIRAFRGQLIKVSVKGDGTLTSSSAAVTAHTSWS